VPFYGTTGKIYLLHYLSPLSPRILLSYFTMPLQRYTYFTCYHFQLEKVLPFSSVASPETKTLYHPSCLLVGENSIAFFMVSLKKYLLRYASHLLARASFPCSDHCNLSVVLMAYYSLFLHHPTIIRYFFVHTTIFFNHIGITYRGLKRTELWHYITTFTLVLPHQHFYNKSVTRILLYFYNSITSSLTTRDALRHHDKLLNY
jgi:hypothetical protein